MTASPIYKKTFANASYKETYDPLHIQALKKNGHYKDILFDTTIFWRVFCDSFCTTNPYFGTLSATDRQMHLHHDFKHTLLLKDVIESIRRAFLDVANTKTSSVTISVIEEFQRITVHYPFGSINISKETPIDFSFKKLVIPHLPALISSFGATVSFEPVSSVSSDFEGTRFTIEWKQNIILMSLDKKNVLTERANAQRTLFINALGGLNVVQALPIVARWNNPALITAPVMRSEDNNFFVFRYMRKDKDESDDIYYTALINTLIFDVSSGVLVTKKDGWNVTSIGTPDSDTGGCGQIGPRYLNSNAAYLEMTCRRIKGLMHHDHIGLLYRDTDCEWFEEEESKEEGFNAVELM